MIASINGRLQEKTGEGLIIEIGGLGWLVHVPTPVRDRLNPSELVFLHTCLIVRQDLWRFMVSKPVKNASTLPSCSASMASALS